MACNNLCFCSDRRGVTLSFHHALVSLFLSGAAAAAGGAI